MEKITNQEKLDEMYELVQENNELLSSLLRREKISNFFKILYWLVILGTLFGAYYYIQPYLDIALKNFNAVQGTLNQINSISSQLPEVNNLKNVLDGINNLRNN